MADGILEICQGILWLAMTSEPTIIAYFFVSPVLTEPLQMIDKRNSSVMIEKEADHE